MTTYIVGCERKAVSMLCACVIEAEVVDFSVVKICSGAKTGLIRAATALSGDPASSFAHHLCPQNGCHALIVGCGSRNDGLAMEASYSMLQMPACKATT